MEVVLRIERSALNTREKTKTVPASATRTGSQPTEGPPTQTALSTSVSATPRARPAVVLTSNTATAVLFIPLFILSKLKEALTGEIRLVHEMRIGQVRIVHSITALVMTNVSFVWVRLPLHVWNVFLMPRSGTIRVSVRMAGWATFVMSG
jgi:hypothetical protein